MKLTRDEIQRDIEELKSLMTKGENLSLSETLELYRLRSYYFKNFGITSEDIKYISTDELVERVYDITSKVNNLNLMKEHKKLTLDEIFNDVENDIDDYRKILRKSLIQKSIEIRKGGRDIKFIMGEDKIILNVPKNVEINEEKPEDKNNKKTNNGDIEPEDIFDTIAKTVNTPSPKKNEEIIYVDDIPILKFTGKRYRTFKHSISDFDNQTLRKIANKLKEIFDNKYINYFMRIFGISSRRDVKKILEETNNDQINNEDNVSNNNQTDNNNQINNNNNSNNEENTNNQIKQ